MIFSRAWFALMRRNLVYRKRHWLATLLELALPMGFVGVLLGIKSAVEGTSNFMPETVPAFFPANEDVFTPFTFDDYVTALQAKRVCEGQSVTDPSTNINYEYFDITGMPMQAYSWQVPMVKCDPRNCKSDGEDGLQYCEFAIVALSGTDEGGLARASLMKDYILGRYPVLTDTEAIPVPFELIQLFNSTLAMDEYVKSPEYGKTGFPKLAMGIVFEGNDPDNYRYQLRQNSTNFNNPTAEGRPAVATTPDTTTKFASFAKTDDEPCVPLDGAAEQGEKGNSCTGQYAYNGVLTFQRLVGDFILDQTGAAAAGYKISKSGVQYVPFPTREYEEEGFYGAIAAFAPLLIVLGMLYPVSSMISYIVKEKELRQKELMKMMSVAESDIGWSWFSSFFVFNIISATLTAMVANQVYENSDNSFMWIFWLYTFTAITTFCMGLAAVTSKTTRAVLIGVLLFLAGYFISISVDYTTSSGSVLSLVGLHPVVALSFGLQEIGRLEDLGIGISSNSIDFSELESGYNFRQALNSLFADVIIWGILSWYLNRVIRPDYGQAQPLYFPFTSSYWCPGRKSAHHESEEANGNAASEHVPLEPVGEALKRQSVEGQSIEIKNLVKKFDDKVAVDGLNLTMYSGQITALLGHNGAGKTTTISMLTGALSPTSGHAIIAGKDIRSDMLAIRQDIGICLQHDCLFPELTVREHVQFFSRLKGLYSTSTKEEAENHIDQAIRDVALFDKRNTLSKNLSGGMKRKLSVAMAFCGGSKVVLLDEPTSGMDPFSRRFTWNVIRQYRRDRCIILTTHFMDEADILGDRIAIMAEGQLRCAGSSLFLKKTFGVGYQLTIEKVKSSKVNSTPDLVGLGEHDEKLMNLVESNVSDANLLTNVGSELSYQLPIGAASQFGPMFKALDEEIERGSLTSYGVGITTLDEVFLLVARGEGTGEKKEFASSKHMDGVTLTDEGTKSARSRMDLENEGLFFRHIGALLKKRAAFFRRDKKAWCCTTLLPSLFVFVGFLLFKFVALDRNLDSLVLDLNDYNMDISELRNPIPFNSPENPFICQPGSCFYPEEKIESETTNESYFFCGGQGRLAGSEKCSITVSSAVISQIDDAGAEGVDLAVEDVGESSSALSTSMGVGGSAATQYGAIFFTKDQFSTLEDSSSFEQAASNACIGLAPELNYTSADDCLDFGGIGYVIQYNFTALHVAPLYQALADEALVREALGNTNFNVECTIAPLPITKNEESFGEAEDAFNAWFLVVLSFPFIGGAFASFVVAERESKAKHLQTVAGVEPSAYWLSTFLWDVMNYQIPLWITVILMLAFDVGVLTTRTANVFGGVLTLLFLFGPASAAFAYCVSFAFKSPSLCFIFLMISGFLIGMGGPLAIFILQIIGEDRTDPNAKLVDIASVVTWFLRWNPYFCLGKGLFNVINIESFRYWEADANLNAFSEPILGLEVLFLAIQSVVYLVLAVCLDIWSSNPAIMSVWNAVIATLLCRRCCGGGNVTDEKTLPDDSDVVEEQDRVLRGEANDDLIVISQLTKTYDTGKKAVDNMSLGIPAGECFGLLGVNGAGKTTTMGMLTAEFPPTSGDATLAGFSVSREPQKTRRRIGYCPQFDAHFANLTGREHVELYASIKGVPKALVKEAAAAKLQEVGLSDKDSDRLSAGYSGGMKRRLSLACATIGQPQIVFLDECSTGVDPVARREIWQLVSDMVSGPNVPANERTSVILTTHSMEECEALCPRIGIMANGKLRCLGSAQHLKNKFGQGYQVELKVKIVATEDEDYVANATSLAKVKNASIENPHEVLYSLDEARSALRSLTQDNFLADMVNEENANGYAVWKDATSGFGVALDTLAAFATVELRMKKVEDFVKGNYPNYVLRERQDTKARYEVSSKGVRISELFASIETEKENLRLSDYGVSQTSLEQVFNMHAAEAEELKQGRNDH